MTSSRGSISKSITLQSKNKIVWFPDVWTHKSDCAHYFQTISEDSLDGFISNLLGPQTSDFGFRNII